MISRIDLRGRAPASLSRTALATVVPRAATDVEAAVAQIRPVCEDVKRRGAEAVREYTMRFDGVDLATTRVPPEALDAALAGLDPDVRAALAAAVFAGPYSPVSLGDYLAGSNHVLPTGGTARHTSGLSVFPFLRLVNVVECDRAALAATAPVIDALGGAEDLAAHVAAVRVRVPREGGAG